MCRQFSEQSPQVHAWWEWRVEIGVIWRYGGFPKMVGFPNKPMGFPTKDDHFGVEIGGTTVEGNTHMAGKNVLLKQFGMIGISVYHTPEILFYRVWNETQRSNKSQHEHNIKNSGNIDYLIVHTTKNEATHGLGDSKVTFLYMFSYPIYLEVTFAAFELKSSGHEKNITIPKKKVKELAENARFLVDHLRCLFCTCQPCWWRYTSNEK